MTHADIQRWITPVRKMMISDTSRGIVSTLREGAQVLPLRAAIAPNLYIFSTFIQLTLRLWQIPDHVEGYVISDDEVATLTNSVFYNPTFLWFPKPIHHFHGVIISSTDLLYLRK
jgi:hypothetical protein